MEVKSMNTRKIVISLIFLIAILLAACSPKTAPTEIMAEKEMTSAGSSETMEDKDAAMMEEKDDSMSDDAMMAEDEMSTEQSDEAMMDDKSDEMMSDNMTDDSDQMGDHSDDTMMNDNEDAMMEENDDSMSDDAMMVPNWLTTSFTDVNSGQTFSISDFKDKVVLVETMAIWCSNCFQQQGQVKTLHNLLGERDDFVSLGVDIDPNENAEALQVYTNQNSFDWLYIVAPTEVSREIGQLYGDQFLNPPSTPMLIIDRNGEVHLLPFGIKSAESLLEALQPFLDAEM
jgi:thiol-disulfide isomerase/thioredoxin